MGCSPSKGKLFCRPAMTVLESVKSIPEEDVDKYMKTRQKSNELPLPDVEDSKKDTALSDLKPQSDTAAQNTGGIKETTEDEIDRCAFVQSQKVQKKEKRKKKKHERKSSIVQKKVDLPRHMVRAHQAAYSFLNPNISKCETLLGLLDQAAQTQLSLQPIITALVLSFEEINQALEEMAEEGELMLKEHGDFMALPCGLTGPVVRPAKPSTDSANSPGPPPNLLQQMLQHSTERMKLVGSSVQVLSDTSLGEAVEYFSSISKVLGEKLQAKKLAEQRLSHVLKQVEGAAFRKSTLLDSALHSEDSGIGGENESMTGSEKHRHHRGSAGSDSCGSGVNVRSATESPPKNVPSLTGQNEVDEDEEENDDDDDEEEEEFEEEEDNRPERKRSNSSPPDPSQPLFYMQEQQRTVKRPLTAVTVPNTDYSSSVMLELQDSKKDLDRRMKAMVEIQGKKAPAGRQYHLYKALLRRNSLNESAGAQNLPLRTNHSPLAPRPPKHHSVRRLINNFSQGVDGRTGEDFPNNPPHIRRLRKCGIPLSSDTENGHERCSVVNGNNNNNSWPDGKDDLDVDNLPPPPPEVLQDNSFQRNLNIPTNEEGLQYISLQSLPVISHKAGVSQRLKVSLQNVEVLPNRASTKPKSDSTFPACPTKEDVVMEDKDAQEQPKTDIYPEKVNCLLQQAQKILQLRNAAESSGQEPSPLQDRMGPRCENNQLCAGEMSACYLPVTAPPVSRVRLPPSCPSARPRVLSCSPPVLRHQSATRASSRPSSPRTAARVTKEFIPSVSFREARSVFCQEESQNSQTRFSVGSSVLPRPWGEVSRGRLTTRLTDNSTRRTKSEQRTSLTSHSEFSKDGSSTSGW
ncbi:hypothetical protein JOB18_007683 [Solea senegalensis]|uniref:Photoreceptor cilium actin regulator n=1 Tax=Solea senegalensis TaxID=28829 RepID=A0AAV6RWU7_SOLSE|nr:uncharacterized protein pcare2 isoform X2 [Solea senegalensis]KAG7508246.1 hypothetical protein JOB18_007683 [Solea senegalensis]